MFTGLVQGTGRVTSVRTVGGDRRVTVHGGRLLQRVKRGDSVAVSGICLTAATVRAGRLTADLSTETLDQTTAGSWARGTRVNLEASLTLSTPLGGHLISGHVDDTAPVLSVRGDARSVRLEVGLPRSLARYVAGKGSIGIDGVSLTVNAVGRGRFAVNMVPHTARHTTLGDLTTGDLVNLEVDLVARYLERLTAGKH